jgi:hypothetical protein
MLVRRRVAKTAVGDEGCGDDRCCWGGMCSDYTVFPISNT